MENTTRLLWRQEALLQGRHLLVVDADDGELARLPAASVQLHADRADVAAACVAPWPGVPSETDLVVIILPKSRERLEALLAVLASAVERPTECWLVGPGQGGIRGALKQFARFCGEPESLDSARHCKLYRGQLTPTGTDFDVQGVLRCWQVDGLQCVSLPGVFSHGRLDEGSALLLDALRESPPQGTVLDMGCGAGVLSAVLARQGAQVTAVDLSASAVWSTRETLARNGLAGTVLNSDLYAAVPGRFRHLVTNPPFHEGLATSTQVTRVLIGEAHRHLLQEGVLWMVANVGLPYEDWLDEAFAERQLLRESRRFRVWRCTGPRQR